MELLPGKVENPAVEDYGVAYAEIYITAWFFHQCSKMDYRIMDYRECVVFQNHND